MSSSESIQRPPYSRLIFGGKYQGFLRRRRSSNFVRLSSLFLFYTLILSRYEFFLVEVVGGAHDTLISLILLVDTYMRLGKMYICDEI